MHPNNRLPDYKGKAKWICVGVKNIADLSKRWLIVSRCIALITGSEPLPF